MLPHRILLQVESIMFHAPAGQTGKANFKLSFYGGAGQLVAQYPASGYGSATYGQEFKPAGGLFTQLYESNDVAGAYLHVVAHDEKNPPDEICVQGPHGQQICTPESPMELYWGGSIGGGEFRPVNGHNNDPAGRSREMNGANFQEYFTLKFFAWGDPPIVVGGNQTAVRAELVR